MTKAGGDQPKSQKPQGRDQRLAQALRANLKRRKAQIRARAPQSGGSGTETEDEKR